jgi:hypothetical protein
MAVKGGRHDARHKEQPGTEGHIRLSCTSQLGTVQVDREAAEPGSSSMEEITPCGFEVSEQHRLVGKNASWRRKRPWAP